MSLRLSRLVIAFLPRSKHLLILWLQSPSTPILEPKRIKFATVFIFSLSVCHEVMGLDAMILVFWMLSFLFLNYLFSVCATQHVGILVLWPESNPCPWHWKHRVLTIGHQGSPKCWVLRQHFHSPLSSSWGDSFSLHFLPLGFPGSSDSWVGKILWRKDRPSILGLLWWLNW